MKNISLLLITMTIIYCASSPAQVKYVNSIQKDKVERILLNKLNLSKGEVTFDYFDLNKDGKEDAVIIREARENVIYGINPLKELWIGPAYCSPSFKIHKRYRDVEATYFGVSGVRTLKWNGSKYE